MKMKYRRDWILGLLAGTLTVAAACASSSGGLRDVVADAADRLAANQSVSGDWGEEGFVGEAMTGLACTQLVVANDDYRDAANAAGDFVLAEAGYSPASGTYDVPLYAAEAYGLTRLSQITSTPFHNPWRTATGDLFSEIRRRSGTTADFIDDIVSDYGSSFVGTAVYDIARFTATAGYVSDVSLPTWRSKLMDTLADIDDDADAPALALGSAVWALAATGEMDDTTLSGSSSVLNGKKLSELPGMMADLQDVDGSFFWTFGGDYPGYTEPTVMAALGLMAANGGAYSSEISAAVSALEDGVDVDGAAYFLIGDDSTDDSFYFAGETLEALAPAAAVPGDANGDGVVDDLDLTALAAHWQQPGGLAQGDFNGDGFISDLDLTVLATAWPGSGLDVSPVPEPATLSLLAFGMFAVTRRRRR